MRKPNKNSYKELSSQEHPFSVADRLTTKNVYIDGITDDQLQDLKTRVNANASIRTFDKFINSLVSGEESWSGQRDLIQEKLFQSVISDEDFLKKLQLHQYYQRAIKKAVQWSKMDSDKIKNVIDAARDSYIDARDSSIDARKSSIDARKSSIDWPNGTEEEFTKTTISNDSKCARQRENNDTFRIRRNEQINSQLMRNVYRHRQWNEFKSTFFDCGTQSYLNCNNVTVFVASSVLILGVVKTLPLFVAGLAATAILPGLAFPLIAGAILLASYGALCADKFKRAGKKVAEDIKKEADKTVQSQLKEEKLKAHVAKAKADLQPLLVACEEYNGKYGISNIKTIVNAQNKITDSGSKEQIDEVIREVVDTITLQLENLKSKATTTSWSLSSSVDKRFTELKAAYDTLQRTIPKNDSESETGYFGEPIQEQPLYS